MSPLRRQSNDKKDQKEQEVSRMRKQSGMRIYDLGYALRGDVSEMRQLYGEEIFGQKSYAVMQQ